MRTEGPGLLTTPSIRHAHSMNAGSCEPAHSLH